MFKVYWRQLHAAGARSKASDVERSRLASIWAFRSAILCSAVPTASAPAMKRRGGGSWLAMVMSARASFAGSPDCRPFSDCPPQVPCQAPSSSSTC